MLTIAKADTFGDYTFTITNSSAIISKYIGAGGDVVIPDSIQGNAVIGIGSSAFRQCTNLTSVSIPGSVLTIEKQAFAQCNRLRNVTLTNGMVSIGDYAFSECNRLRDIKIPGSTTNIGTGAFSCCLLLGNASLDNGVASIGSRAFSCCNVLTNITLPDSITTIGSEAFSQCPNLKMDFLPGGLTSIAPVLFSGCTSLEGIVIPNTVTNLGDSAFSQCAHLTSITIPDSVRAIGKFSFSQCTALKSLKIPASVASLGDRAYANCPNLARLYFDGDAPIIASTNIFENTVSVTIHRHPETAGWNTTFAGRPTASWNDPNEGDFNYLREASLVKITGYKGPGGDVIIPTSIFGDAVTSIGDSAFVNCSQLTSITFPSRVKAMGFAAFANCTNLLSLFFEGNAPATAPNNLFENASRAIVYYRAGTTGWNATFAGRPTALWRNHDVPNMTFQQNGSEITITAYAGPEGDLVIPDTMNDMPVARIGAGAFKNMNNLRTITISDNVTQIGASAFFSCPSLTTISIPNGVLNIDQMAFSLCESLTDVVIPQSVTNIAKLAFSDCTNLINLTLSNGVVTIGDWAFYNCPELTNIVIPSSVTTLGAQAFAECTGLKKTVIGNGINGLGSEAFAYCPQLASIYFEGNAPVSTPTNLFRNTTHVTVYYRAGTTGWSNTFAGQPTALWIEQAPATDFTYGITNSAVTITKYTGPGGNVIIPDMIEGKPVTSIGYAAFQSCVTLTNITIPNSVTLIGIAAFSGCTGLLDIFIPNSVTIIEDDAFLSCTGLTDIAVPNSVTSLGHYVFDTCTSLTNATIGSGVASIGMKPFHSCPNLETIKVDALNPSYSSIDGVLFDKYQTVLILCPSRKSGDYIVPNSVTKTIDKAFNNCIDLKSVAFPSSFTNLGAFAFTGCTSLEKVYFEGNLPSYYYTEFDAFNQVTVYYRAGTTGWTSTFAGQKTVMWNPQALISDAAFGVHTNQYGFNISGTAGVTVVVEACTNLSNPTWLPVATNTFTSASSYFSDPQWTNYPSRFYRFTMP